MTTPYYTDDAVTLYHGDCLDVLRDLPDASIDAVVTDPPYDLTSSAGRGFMGKEWDGTGIAFRPDVWRECLRVLKPGGHMLAFGGTRTWHRLACAVEDAGFEVRDSIAWLYGCLTPDVEVLTEHGWKPGIDVTTGERIAQWDPATDAITLAPVQETFRAPWDGPMRVLRHTDTDQMLTPNHRVYHRTFDRRQTAGVRTGEWSGWKVSQAGDLPYRFTLPIAGTTGTGTGIGGVDYAALLGWVWTEGGFDPSGTGVRIYQSSVNQDKCDEIASLLDRIAPQHKRYDRDRTYTRRNGGEHRYTESTWFISGDLARRVRDDLPGKRPTYPLLWRMTAGEVEAMIRAAMLGDGTDWEGRCPQFYQQHEDDLVWFQTALHLTGRSGKVGMRGNRPGGAVYLRNRATTEFQPRHLRDSWADYTGDVWCVRVPTGAFLARRNGRVFISGNSGFPKSLDVSKAIDKAAGAEREVVGTTARRVGPAGTRKVDGLTGSATFRENPDNPGNILTAPATDDARRWQGWGTALKPAFEPVVVARKPLAGTVAANVLAHGTGALNIDGCRIGTDVITAHGGGVSGEGRTYGGGAGIPAIEAGSNPHVGRWPANVVLTHLPGCREVGTTGERVGGGAAGSSGFVDGYERGDGFDGREVVATVWACEPGCQVRELDKQSGVSESRIGKPRGADSGDGWGMTATGAEYADTGGASRFFPVFRYEAKAPTSERPRVKADAPQEAVNERSPRCAKCGYQRVNVGESICKCEEPEWVKEQRDYIAHPTVKPLDLMRWLVRLVTPPGGVVLEPFAGSGTTAEACVIEGFKCIAIEREADYLPLIVQRLTKPIQPDLFGGAA